MCRVHLTTSTVARNADIPSSSSCFMVGFTSRRMYSFNSCHKFLDGVPQIATPSRNLWHDGVAIWGLRRRCQPVYTRAHHILLGNSKVCWGHCPAMNLYTVGKYIMYVLGRRVLSNIAL